HPRGGHPGERPQGDARDPHDGARPRPEVSDDCAFCAIVSGEAPAQRVLDDDVAVAFLDRRPLFPGHVLVVPRTHHETLTDLPPDDVAPLFARVRDLARAVEDGTGAAGTYVAMNN